MLFEGHVGHEIYEYCIEVFYKDFSAKYPWFHINRATILCPQVPKQTLNRYIVYDRCYRKDTCEQYLKTFLFM